jgi:hypothetical protein
MSGVLSVARWHRLNAGAAPSATTPDGSSSPTTSSSSLRTMSYRGSPPESGPSSISLISLISLTSRIRPTGRRPEDVAEVQPAMRRR